MSNNPNDITIPIPDVYTPLVSATPYEGANIHSHNRQSISCYNDVIDIPSLPSTFDLFMCDVDDEDVGTLVVTDTSAMMSADTNIDVSEYNNPQLIADTSSSTRECERFSVVEETNHLCTQLDNGASLSILYDTHMICDVTMPSDTCVDDDALLPQQKKSRL